MATRLATREIRRLEGVNSELIGSERGLLRAETLAANGPLAAGVAYDRKPSRGHKRLRGAS